MKLVNSNKVSEIKNLLLIGSEPILARLISRRLLKNDIVTIPVYDPTEAFEHINDKSPQIVMFDIVLPKVNGFEMLTFLSRHPFREKFKILVNSSRNNLNDERDSLNAGADDFIKKPFDLELLCERVSKIF